MLSPAEKVTDIVCSMDWFRLVQLGLATIFISFSAKCHFQATQKVVNSKITKKKNCHQSYLLKNEWTVEPLCRECIFNCTNASRFINKNIKLFFGNSRKLVTKDLNIRIKIISLFWRHFVSQKYSGVSEWSGLYFQYHDHSCKLDLYDPGSSYTVLFKLVII